MYKKIDKNYLSQTLMHLDIDGNQIIDPQEWLVFFDKYKNNIWMTAKTLLTYILKDTFPNESLEKLPMLAEAVLLNHCDDEEKKKINLLKLYNYVIRFIAPQKYRVYQQTLEDKKNFFLYDGVFQHQELEIFTDNNNRLFPSKPNNSILLVSLCENGSSERTYKCWHSILCRPDRQS